jgi:hypothetical protein
MWKEKDFESEISDLKFEINLPPPLFPLSPLSVTVNAPMDSPGVS